VILFVLTSTGYGQHVRAEAAVTTESKGASVNLDLNYYHSKSRLIALGRLFIHEPQINSEPNRRPQDLTFEAAVGRLFRKGQYLFTPLAGIDSEMRIIAGTSLATTIHRHTVAYLGYANLAVESDDRNGMRHRVMIDLNRVEKMFLRMDWKMSGKTQEHFRLGVEFHTRIDKMNLPVYLEPFWNFPAKQVGFRVGTRL
jgi:hypothetical protein